MPIPSDVAAGTADRGDAVDRALARSVLYRAAALAFHFPDAPTVARLRSSAAQEAILEAASLVDHEEGTTKRLPRRPRSATKGDHEGHEGHEGRDHEGHEAGNHERHEEHEGHGRRLRRAAERFVGQIREEWAHDGAEQFARLFGHTARGAVCVYETEYGSETLYGQPQAVADIAGYYRAFGLQPAGSTRERADHVGCECAFMEFLALKEARALEALIRFEADSAEAGEAGDAEQETLEETRRTARQFLRDHLARFGPAFARSTMDADGDGFHASAAALLLGLLEIECVRLGVALGPPVVELRSTADDRIPMPCGDEGGGQELIQIQRARTPAR